MDKKIVKVQFRNRFTGEYSGAEYSYYAEEDLQVGDEVTVPTKFGDSGGKITQINVSEFEVITFKEYMKTIPKRVQKEEEA